MMLRLIDLDACFEGVIPSIIATAAPDGTPNISYLSQVIRVDDERVALSNQFFGKTATNLRANPQAAILLVDGRTGQQVRLEVCHEESLERGEMFDRVAAQIAASSAEVGMAGVMRLKALDVFRVLSIAATPSATELGGPGAASPSLAAVAAVTGAIAGASDAGAILDAVLDGLTQELGYEAAMAFLHDRPREVLATVDSRGMGRRGAGSEVRFGQGVAGVAAAERQLVKVSDLSRVRRFGAAIRGGSDSEDRTRTILLPGLLGARSQMAVSLVAQGTLHGVLMVESARALAFGPGDEAALTLIGSQTAAALALAEMAEPDSVLAVRTEEATSAEISFRVVSYPHDDSVFIEGDYIIKGVAGRLLMFLLERHLAEARTEFTNREIRLSDKLRLPDLKDNLETRLLLLRRRLEERSAPVRLVSAGRGRVRLDLQGRPRVETAT
jgi:adenylate cyclase